MKISEQGFTERLPSQANRATSVGDSAQSPFSKISGRQTSSDNLQLSNLASRLQNASSTDAGRAGRLSQIAKAVKSNTFTIDPAQISRAMVSEAVQSNAR
ncbi:MAG: flagellar biosynthesis anti-sigma factor FlgM [Acidobacteriota bacterium]|nr:flagellar biosynthesis anti-sigma factor FlgM [Acidobacteriota bacterium]